MPTRYGRHAADGTTEYHDSKESLIQAERRENREARAGLFGFIGLLIGGVLTYVAFVKLGGMALPKWIRFTGVIVGAGMSAYVFAKLSNLLWNLILMAILAAIVFGIGSAIWRAV
ncbi:hypothetical protein LPN04_02395 [Rugamonas sp. A1-17]|nr:hypothetical protein [Rugamonas sp. A1-17]